ISRHAAQVSAAVTVHVVDVEIDSVGRQAPLAELARDPADDVSRIVAVARLVVPESPARPDEGLHRRWNRPTWARKRRASVMRPLARLYRFEGSLFSCKGSRTLFISLLAPRLHSAPDIT